jgi:hypothetical protein
MMKRWVFVLVVLFAAALAGAQEAAKTVLPEDKPAELPMAKVKVPGHGELKAYGPVIRQNLAYYYLYAEKDPGGGDFLTLSEGVKDGSVKITEAERESVQTLLVSNTSKRPLFLHLGEVVSGGKQDRTLQTSLVVPPGVKEMPIPSFCVEQSRWSGGKTFGASNYIAPSPVTGGNVSRQQGQVWESVRGNKAIMRSNAAVTQPSETSSLHEELSGEEFKKAQDKYTEGIKIPPPRSVPVGMAYAINGEFRSLNVYNSGSLFKALHEMLVQSAAAEALATPKPEGKMPAPPKVKELATFIANAWDGKKHVEKLGHQNEFTRIEGDKTWVAELRYKDQLVHSQVLRREKTGREDLTDVAPPTVEGNNNNFSPRGNISPLRQQAQPQRPDTQPSPRRQAGQYRLNNQLPTMQKAHASGAWAF